MTMPGFIKKANGGAGTKPKAKPRSKGDAKARVEAFYEDLQVLADQEEAPSSMTAADIQKIWFPAATDRTRTRCAYGKRKHGAYLTRVFTGLTICKVCRASAQGTHWG
jgi:hypothetical protein